MRQRQSRSELETEHTANGRAVVQAFLAVVESNGLKKNVTLAAVAKRKGVTLQVIEEMFPSRAELIDFTAAEGFDRLLEALSCVPAQPGCDAKRAALARAYVQFASEHAALYEVMFSNTALQSRHARLAPEAAHALTTLFVRIFGQAKSCEAWLALHCGSARRENAQSGRKRRTPFERGFCRAQKLRAFFCAEGDRGR